MLIHYKRVKSVVASVVLYTIAPNLLFFKHETTQTLTMSTMPD